MTENKTETTQVSGTTATQAESKPKRASRPIKKDGSRLRRVKVHRMDGNKHLPVVVCVNSRRNRREFAQGVEVELTEQMIGALKDAVVSHDIPVPEGSGVYESTNPRAEAIKQNPGWDARIDIMSGQVFVCKSEPIYVVEYLDQ